MNLPILIQQLYGKFTFTGLYSFEFVDKNRNTITEIFLMCPPKQKSINEQTRSSTVPTLGGNYNLDAGNATKSFTLSGELFFPYVGSPDNPIARDAAGLQNKIDGLSEYLKLRWMLIRYRDYTMSKNSKMTIPSSILAVSKEINALYKKLSQLLKRKVGCLYDQVSIIFHDYDMDDHYYCRINGFNSSQSDDKYIVANYTIDLECYEPDTGQKRNIKPEIKKSSNERADIVTTQLNAIDYDTTFDNIQSDIGYNVNFLSTAISIGDYLSQISDENDKIQAGTKTVLDDLPTLVSNLSDSVESVFTYFIDVFLSPTQKTSYQAGTITIDDYVSRDLLFYYNNLQKIKLQINSFNSIIKTTIKQSSIRYYENADDYTLTTDQFDSENSNKVESSSNFFFYTIQDGDSLRTIAQRKLNDHEQFIKILKINDISESDLIDGSLIGQKIKIPYEASILSRGDDNLVFESNINDLNAFLYGKDIKTDINNNIIISSKGDFLAQVGIENVYDNVTNRVKNLKGSLNVFNPNWGTIAVDDSNAPLYVKIDRYLSDLTSQLQADPRVESVQMNLEKLELSGETIRASFNIFPIEAEEAREVVV